MENFFYNSHTTTLRQVVNVLQCSLQNSLRTPIIYPKKGFCKAVQQRFQANVLLYLRITMLLRLNRHTWIPALMQANQTSLHLKLPHAIA
mmetsp:Transcript_19588/g.66634  ORF Transcript_19588/g.66634 Transcript_19588/m.66634 type:complete len:90 (-) Transcript_19588:3550-3819(-)